MCHRRVDVSRNVPNYEAHTVWCISPKPVWLPPFGLSLSSFGSGVENKKPANLSIGKKISMYKIGIEYKWFPIKGKNYFLRESTGLTNLKGDNLSFLGIFIGHGLGYEIRFSKIGLAFEMAGQINILEKGAMDLLFNPSIGVHFYGYL